MTYLEGKWARQLISLQKEDGSWGYFHTLSEPRKNPVTTEQALRRLSILGYTIEQPCIAKTVEYMSDCLRGKRKIPDRREKTHDWVLFTNMMLSTWIRRFTLSDPLANETAEKWREVLTGAFSSGQYCDADYRKSYEKVFSMIPRGGRFQSFVSFYQVSLLADQLDRETERNMMDYILSFQEGIYYIYQGYLKDPPELFQSKQASRYLGAIELLSGYQNSTDMLAFVKNWLEQNRKDNGNWDMGSQAKDRVYFPLSDDWRELKNREADCTYRVENLLKQLTSGKRIANASDCL